MDIHVSIFESEIFRNSNSSAIVPSLVPLGPRYATDVYSVGRLNVNTSALHFELIDSKHGQLLVLPAV